MRASSGPPPKATGRGPERELLEVVSAGTGSWDATVSVQAASAWEAVMSGAPHIEKLACKVGMPDRPLVRAEAVLQDLLDAANARPTLPELVSLSEGAKLLGVYQRRVRELSANHAGFPAPMCELRTGKLWLKEVINAFAQRWERKPGRPRKIRVSPKTSSGRPMGPTTRPLRRHGCGRRSGPPPPR
jgi:hypothetical protein